LNLQTMKTNHFFRSLAITVLVWLAVADLLCAADAPKPVEVASVTPTRGDIYRFVTLPGSIKANQQATLYAKVPGYLKSITVDKGDRVTAGQSLGEIEVPELAADAVKYRAEVQVAETDFKRLSEAAKTSPDLVTPQAVDEAQGRLDIAKANLERTETLLKYSHLVAPFSGVVTMRFVDPGAFIPSATSGSAAQTAAVVTLMDFDTVRVQVAVPEVEAAFVRTGEPVRVTTESLPGKTFAGMVSRQSFALDEATRSVLVEADLPNADLALRPGMYATIKIGVEKHADALLIPAAALVTEKSGASVLVASNGKAKKTPIKAGFSDGLKVEVLSGLAGNEAVILAGKTPPADGAAITVTEAK
jgi:RND family efflux transporter MFP subunit